MGREIHRVPLDFNWPLNKPWKGFLNPHFKPCPEENKTCWNGTTAAGRWLDAIARLVAMVGNEAVAAPNADHFRRTGRTYPHPYLAEWTQAPREKWSKVPLPLTPELASLVEGLTGGRDEHWSRPDVFRDYRIYDRLIEFAGLDKEAFGRCPVCKGAGMDPTTREAYEAWVSEPPPKGDGWQLWETVSDGSPISPVFATEQEFIAYLVSEGYSRTAAERFCQTGWAMSGLIVDGKMYRDIESCAVKLGEDGNGA